MEKPIDRLKARKTVTSEVTLTGGSPEWQARVKAGVPEAGASMNKMVPTSRQQSPVRGDASPSGAFPKLEAV